MGPCEERTSEISSGAGNGREVDGQVRALQKDFVSKVHRAICRWTRDPPRNGAMAKRESARARSCALNKSATTPPELVNALLPNNLDGT